MKRWMCPGIVMLALVLLCPLSAAAADGFGRSALAALPEEEDTLWAYDTLLADVQAHEKVSVLREEGRSISQKEVETAYLILSADHPEIFWLGTAYRGTYVANRSAVITPEYSMGADEIDSAQRRIDRAADALLLGLPLASEVETERVLHDRLTMHIKYEETEHCHDLYGALAEGKAVCDGYSRAFQYLLGRLGIESYVVYGSEHGGGHAWNLVRIDGEYYHTDLTWDDEDRHGGTRHLFFNLTEKEIKESRKIDPMPFAYPACTSTAASFPAVYGGGYVSPFRDVAGDAYYEKPARYAAFIGAVDTSTSLLRGGEACSRAEAVELLWRMAGYPISAEETMPFTDVPKTCAYYEAVLWACHAGVVNGVTEQSFAPQRTVTRAQLLSYLFRYFNLEAEQDSVTVEYVDEAEVSCPFTDVPETSYSYDAILWASMNGIARGVTADTFQPNRTLSRVHALTFLYRYFVGV